jgi:hypothetical protein
MQKLLRKHHVTFVKVVGDSDIYNFPVHLVLHFSSIFERKMSSKSPRLKWVRAAPRRIATSHARSAPRPRATPARQPPQRPRRRASRGSCVVQGRTFPRPTRAPRRSKSARRHVPARHPRRTTTGVRHPSSLERVSRPYLKRHCTSACSTEPDGRHFRPSPSSPFHWYPEPANNLRLLPRSCWSSRLCALPGKRHRPAGLQVTVADAAQCHRPSPPVPPRSRLRPQKSRR